MRSGGRQGRESLCLISLYQCKVQFLTGIYSFTGYTQSNGKQWGRAGNGVACCMVCPLHFLSSLDGLCMFYRWAATYPQMEDTPTSTMMTYPGRSAPLCSPHPVLAG